MINNCIKCGEPFEVSEDEKWKTTCLDCWIKEQYPESWVNNHTIIDIKCSVCGTVFVGKISHDKCSFCYRNEQQARQIENTDENYNPTEAEGDGY